MAAAAGRASQRSHLRRRVGLGKGSIGGDVWRVKAGFLLRVERPSSRRDLAIRPPVWVLLTLGLFTTRAKSRSLRDDELGGFSRYPQHPLILSKKNPVTPPSRKSSSLPLSQTPPRAGRSGRAAGRRSGCR